MAETVRWFETEPPVGIDEILEGHVAPVDLGFTAAPDFDPKRTLLPAPVVMGLKRYWAHPEVRLVDAWLPQPWQREDALQDVLRKINLSYETPVEDCLARDSVFRFLEVAMNKVSHHSGKMTQELENWWNLLRACYRARGDEVATWDSEGLQEPNPPTDELWVAITTKLAAEEPASLKPNK